jgi:hypothetical protein
MCLARFQKIKMLISYKLMLFHIFHRRCAMAKFMVIVVVFGSILWAAVPSDTCKQETWVTNGSVYAICPAEDKVYIGGHFTHVGPYTGGAVPINTSTGLPFTTFPKINGSVSSSCPDGKGGWYVGGKFSRVNDILRNNIAHVLFDGTVDLAWNPMANSYVHSLAVSGNTVYVGGSFTSIGGQSRNNIAALDDTTGNATAWNSDGNGDVMSLAVSGNTVYAGGSFTRIGGQSRNNIAALDATTGNATAWDPNANWPVYSLAVSGNTIYAGGEFTSIGGQSRYDIAALDAITGNATAWNPKANDYRVSSLAVSGNTVYAGGSFTSIGGQQIREMIAALDATTGNATAWDPDVGAPFGSVSSLVVSGNTVYIGGGFTSIGIQSRNNIAALDATTGNATSWNPNANLLVYSLAVSGNTVYVGGAFDSIGRGISHCYFAQFGDFNSSINPFNLTQKNTIPTKMNFDILNSGRAMTIRYSLPVAEYVYLRIFKVNGSLQLVIVNKKQGPGNYKLNINRGKLSSGSYIAVFKAGSYCQKKTFLLTK